MIEIYKKTFACIARFWWAYLLIAAVFTALPMLLKSSSGSNSGLWIGYLFFIHFLHRYVLFGDAGLKSAGQKSWGFIGVNLLIGIGVAIVVLGLLFGLPRTLLSNAILSDQNLLVLAFLPPYWLALSLFGTALPASAANEPYGLRLTLQRGRQTAFGIAWRLLLGPGVFASVVYVALLVGTGFAFVALGYDRAQVEQGGQVVMIAGFVLGTLLELVLMTASTMGVVILCQAYRRVQPAPTA